MEHYLTIVLPALVVAVTLLVFFMILLGRQLAALVLKLQGKDYSPAVIVHH